MDPEIVDVAVGHGDDLERGSPVHRAIHARIEGVHRIRVDRIGPDVRVVPGALAQVVLRIGGDPGGAAVVGGRRRIRLGLDHRPTPVTDRGTRSRRPSPRSLGEPRKDWSRSSPPSVVCQPTLLSARNERPRLRSGPHIPAYRIRGLVMSMCQRWSRGARLLLPGRDSSGKGVHSGFCRRDDQRGHVTRCVDPAL